MDNYDTLKAWTDIVIQRFEQKIIMLRITDTNSLLQSFTSQLYTDGNGDVEKIVFGFLYYGKFVDMGVGRGVKIGQAGMNNNRKVRPWMSKVFFNQVYKLGEIIAEKTGKKAEIAIIEELK